MQEKLQGFSEQLGHFPTFRYQRRKYNCLQLIFMCRVCGLCMESVKLQLAQLSYQSLKVNDTYFFHTIIMQSTFQNFKFAVSQYVECSELTHNQVLGLIIDHIGCSYDWAYLLSLCTTISLASRTRQMQASRDLFGQSGKEQRIEC